MPIRGAKVGRSGQFAAIERMITSHGFQHGAPHRMPSPGFYFYNRSGYVIQILPKRQIAVTHPDGQRETISARHLINLDTALDQIVMQIEEADGTA